MQSGGSNQISFSDMDGIKCTILGDNSLDAYHTCKLLTTLVRNIPDRNFPSNTSFITMSRACVIDPVPSQRGTLAHQPPVLLFSPDYAHDLCLDSTDTGSIICTPRVVEITMGRLTVPLIPIYHPIPMDVWRSVDECAAVRTPDSDTADLHRHVHTRVDGTPTFGYALQDSPVLSLPVRKASPSGPNDLPERTLWNNIFRNLLPQLPIAPHFLPLPFRFLPLRYEGRLLP